MKQPFPQQLDAAAALDDNPTSHSVKDGTAAPLPYRKSRAATGVACALLLHAALLMLLLHKPEVQEPVSPSIQASAPITLHLIPQKAQASAPLPEAMPQIEQPKQPRRKPVTVPEAVIPVPPIAQAEPAPPPAPVPEPAAEAKPEPPMDMSAMIEAARERRRLAEERAARINAEAGASNDVAIANIQRSLQGKREGTGGVFQVLHKGVRTGRFVFRGWKPGARDMRQQTFEVDAGLNGDVERAIVRRMIELIRSYYTGDFHWESHRLGRVIVKSARIEDTAELEAFLLREFFEDELSARRY